MSVIRCVIVSSYSWPWGEEEGFVVQRRLKLQRRRIGRGGGGGDLIMMAIVTMYQQCPTQEEQNSNILGTMDEILATTTLMTPMILTIKTLSNGLVSIIAQFPKCSFVSRIVSVLCTCHVLPGCCIGPDGINIVAGALVETVGDTKTKKARRHFCSKYTTR